MENEKQNQDSGVQAPQDSSRKEYLLPASILFSSLLLAGVWVYTSRTGALLQQPVAAVETVPSPANLEEQIAPSEGVTLPVVWGKLGSDMVDVGVIDKDKFIALYKNKGAFTPEYQSLLLGTNNENLKITRENSGYILNMLWALGLGNKNEILEKGEMMNPAYGGAKNFASTGGWTIAKGSSMDHYSRHVLISLTIEQQALVDKVSRRIYRPCCGNSTHFPDCNHGMAMLGLLELMASQGVSEQAMWKTALEVNSYWFPNNYLTIATYMKDKRINWQDVNPETVLGFDYSSAQGYAKIASQVTVQGRGQGAGCGV